MLSLLSYLGRRAANSLLLLLVVSILSLSLVKLTPGDYLSTVRLDPRISLDTLTSLRSEYGLDKPMPVVYWKWLRSIAKGDWGFSMAYNSPASSIILPRARNTLLLAGCATILGWLLAVPIGIAAAARRGGYMDWLANATTALLLGVPEVVLCLLFLLLGASTHQTLLGAPMQGIRGSGASNWEELISAVRRLLLPAVCLALGFLPLLLSHVVTSVAEALEAPFVEAATSFGISRFRILFRWALPVAANSLISLFGLSLGLLISSSLVVEGVFGFPGLGQLMLQAVADRDIFLIVDSALLSASFLVLGNFMADVLLHLSDPRIRTQ